MRYLFIEEEPFLKCTHNNRNNINDDGDKNITNDYNDNIAVIMKNNDMKNKLSNAQEMSNCVWMHFEKSERAIFA